MLELLIKLCYISNEHEIFLLNILENILKIYKIYNIFIKITKLKINIKCHRTHEI